MRISEIASLTIGSGIKTDVLVLELCHLSFVSLRLIRQYIQELNSSEKYNIILVIIEQFPMYI